MFARALSIVLLSLTPLLWSQVDSSGARPAATGPAEGERPMVTPAPVSGEGYSLEYASETRSNYLRGGLGFTSAYDDNILGGISALPVSDVSYSVWPTIALDLSRSRLHWNLAYSPGFTFYQKTTSRNEADQNLALNFQYRLSPHVTLSLRDSLQKTSNVLNQPNPGTDTISGGAQGANQSVIAPLANLLRNIGNAEITYQFGANAMVGASGTFSNLQYPNQAQVPGLSDSSSRAGSAFYTHRLSGRHYIGATYQYQMLLSTPNDIQNKTQTQSILFFYTVYLQRALSLSFFGGPQHSDTEQSGLLPFRKWSPATGVSLGWQGPHSSLAAAYSRIITDGGGLGGAVRSNNGSATARQQFTRNLGAMLGASYTVNTILDPSISSSTGGHTISGNVTLQRSFGPHLNVELGYMRLHQSYDDIPAISSAPNRNRVWVSLSYQFERPLGR